MNISQRAKNLVPSATLAISATARRMRAEGIDVISFGAGEPDFDTPAHIKEAAIQAIREGFTKYTATGGIDELKDAVVAKMKRDNGLSYARNQVLVSCGGKHTLYNIFQARLGRINVQLKLIAEEFVELLREAAPGGKLPAPTSTDTQPPTAG